MYDQSFFLKTLNKTPVASEHGMYPIMNPPVTPMILWNPPSKLENTGTPTAPSKTYKKVEVTAYFQPIEPAARYITRVANDSGIGPTGIENGATAHNTAANNAVNTISRVDINIL